MSAAAVGMTPAFVGWEDIVQGRKEVFLGTAARLHHREPGSRVWDEHVHKTVPAGRRCELGDPSGHVEHALAITRADLERRCLHDAEA